MKKILSLMLATCFLLLSLIPVLADDMSKAIRLCFLASSIPRGTVTTTPSTIDRITP